VALIDQQLLSYTAAVATIVIARFAGVHVALDGSARSRQAGVQRVHPLRKGLREVPGRPATSAVTRIASRCSGTSMSDALWTR
jgi:hypothetical protein